MLPSPSVSGKRLDGVVVAIAIVAFVLSLLYPLTTSTRFDSPDEMGNYVVARSVALGQGLRIASPLTAESRIVHPRSLVAGDGVLLPGSFLGWPLLAGAVGGMFGIGSIRLVTPLLTGLAGLALASLARRVFDRRVVRVTVVLFALHPVVLFWSSRGMYHNVAFLDLTLIGLALLLSAVDVQGGPWLRIWRYGLAGLALGWAAATRTSEIFWLGPVVATLVVVQWRKVDRVVGLPTLMLASLAPLVAIFILNRSLYGGALTTAYTLDASTAAPNFLSRGLQLVLPFGFSFPILVRNAWNYLAVIPWFPALLSTLGAVSFIRRRPTRPQWLVFGLAGFVTLVLLVYYGSWVIHDNPDNPTAVTIGQSYTRYWLPVYVAWLPFAAAFVVEQYDRWRSKRRAWATWAAVAVGGLTLALTTGGTAVWGPVDSLVQSYRHVVHYPGWAAAAARSTPTDSVIVSGRMDKVFFPTRAVVASSDVAADWMELRRLLTQHPVYVAYTPGTSNALLKRVWEVRGFRFGQPLDLGDRVKLYPLHDTVKD